MTVVIALIVGFLAARLVWVMMRPVFATELFLRENFRGHRLPTGAGVVIAVAAILVEATRIVVAVAAGEGASFTSPRAAVGVLAVGLALLGLIDDLAGSGDRRGFRGHVRALLRGRLTTGALKLFGGGGVAIMAVAMVRPATGIGQLLTDAAVVALAANLANLFDLAPGRAIKVGSIAFAALVVLAAADERLAGPAVVVGAALGLLLDDLRERLMLGDAGANVIGGVAGLGLVVVGSPVVRLGALGALFILNGASEWVSFSRVIDRIRPLQALDRAGRRP